MIFGAVIDPNMGDDMRITVIATGFERANMPRRLTTAPTTGQRPAGEQASFPAQQRQQEHASVNARPAQNQQQANSEFRPQVFNTDDLDIPPFLRGKR
jgi:cell division protein FtsZ